MTGARTTRPITSLLERQRSDGDKCEATAGRREKQCSDNHSKTNSMQTVLLQSSGPPPCDGLLLVEVDHVVVALDLLPELVLALPARLATPWLDLALLLTLLLRVAMRSARAHNRPGQPERKVALRSS